MNLTTIARHVGVLVPDAKDIRTRDIGHDAYALLCELAGSLRSVQFDSAGLYGQPITGMFLDWPKSDLHIAAEIAKELKR